MARGEWSKMSGLLCGTFELPAEGLQQVTFVGDTAKNLLLRYTPSALPCQWSHLVGQAAEGARSLLHQPSLGPSFLYTHLLCLPSTQQWEAVGTLWAPRPLPPSGMRGTKTEHAFMDWGGGDITFDLKPIAVGGFVRRREMFWFTEANPKSVEGQPQLQSSRFLTWYAASYFNLQFQFD